MMPDSECLGALLGADWAEEAGITTPSASFSAVAAALFSRLMRSISSRTRLTAFRAVMPP